MGEFRDLWCRVRPKRSKIESLGRKERFLKVKRDGNRARGMQAQVELLVAASVFCGTP